MQTLIQFIRSHPVRAWSERDWGNGFFGVVTKSYKPHSIICHQGDEDDRIFIVKSGWALLYRDLLNGGRQIVDTPLRGDIIDFRFVEGPRYASLSSITELAVFDVSRKELTEAIFAGGSLAKEVTCSLARLNAILAEHLVNIGRRNAITRTAHFLLELEERLSIAGISAQGRYDCPLTQHDLADILGMTAVHVNRTLRELRNADLLSFKAGHVQLINRKKLVKMAGFDNEYLRYGL
ncbi:MULTISPECIES: Crp/Fnr family transcriptional regulator [unclassified Mesorhizobium]|uniref:Crp/Fnr family transcriptional regulator n=1 Tax=unclassified Mesorhizobium TaxID=325217 RepID=UPI0007EDBE22|nr:MULTISPECIES: Crp/Fnr family transcriptional regulator [unclassified Mesorhizobium]RWB25150.1 MAG: Crp/Fnr family transcriptional regulator [Mesorhizobium sp.]RWB31467.1 MAG: Crp/Fnr family transcriptional regulator [Mesorhizobium sp.]RWB71253.1 MAG: Crp/Fnr family transcriptional regulator [Mesorhizobium sp.]RWC24835.1 MAG: Crp/Fnr family transcriptional regulator [Mesorhizobium sp.]RWC35815.1 MAG: Crp/Fnr family transcriptional regulator [Mesorhizobium sp.]